MEGMLSKDSPPPIPIDFLFHPAVQELRLRIPTTPTFPYLSLPEVSSQHSDPRLLH